MSDASMARELVAGLAERLGLETLLSDEEDMALLEFEDAPTINLALDEDGSITLTAHLGDAPQGDLELAEELLASNLNWRDTEGATLSMERFSRGVFLARRWTIGEIGDVQELGATLERFIQLAQRWLEVFPQLAAEGVSRSNSAMLNTDLSGLRG